MRKALLLVSVLALAACSKKDNAPTINFGAGDGYSHYDAQNHVNGIQDATDWTSDANWNDPEQKLFAHLNLSLAGPQSPANDWRGGFYPNQCALGTSGTLYMMFVRNALVLPNSERMSFAVVDAHYNLLDSFDFPTYGKTSDGSGDSRVYFQLYLDPAKYSSNALYRMYYVRYEPEKQVYYRGHGDIRIEK